MNRAFVIGVGVHLDPALPPARYASDDAAAFAKALQQLWVAADHQTALLGAEATKTVIESKLRRLVPRLRCDDTLAVFFSGHAFASDGVNYLVAHDTQADDLLATAIPLHALLQPLGETPARVVAFLDFRPLPESPAEATADLDSAELTALLGDSRRLLGFVARAAGEPSHVSDALKHGVWSHLLLRALAGDAPAALNGSDLLTPRSLHRYLADELPRTLRQVLERPTEQTPAFFGHPPANWALADLGPLLRIRRGSSELQGQRLARVVLWSETRRRVKELSGFQKTHHVPDRVSPAAERFVAAVARDDLQADLDAAYAAVREHLGFKRKDVTLTPAADGAGSLRTPDFDYLANVKLSEDDPSAVVWRREVTHLRSPDLLRRPSFQAAFGNAFQALMFEYAEPLDVAGLVDRLEEAPPAGVRVRCAADGSWCELELAGFPGTVRVERNQLHILARRFAGGGSFWAAFEAFQNLFARTFATRALPAAGA